MTPDKQQLPEEVLDKIEESANEHYYRSKESSYKVAFEAGATATLTDPSIYEKAGLVKEELLDQMTANKDDWYNKWYEAQARIKELEDQLKQHSVNQRNV